jgi:hypothetical protein
VLRKLVAVSVCLHCNAARVLRRGPSQEILAQTGCLAIIHAQVQQLSSGARSNL